MDDRAEPKHYVTTSPSANTTKNKPQIQDQNIGPNSGLILFLRIKSDFGAVILVCISQPKLEDLEELPFVGECSEQTTWSNIRGSQP
jgi:hypothetical protein